MAVMTLQSRLNLIAGILLGFAPSSTPHCLKCGASKNIVWHHPYGRKHVLEIVVPLCRTCHTGRWGIHAALAQAKVDLRYTPDKTERNDRALRACLVFIWWLNEQPEVSEKSRGTIQ
jgi:hypothetical protein